ncbi:MAG: hypothetical protein ACYC3I_16440 [Gemmataceae bacterium]
MPKIFRQLIGQGITPKVLPLPRDRITLELLLRSANEVLAYVDPLRQQLHHQARIIDKVERGDVSWIRLFSKVQDALLHRIAQGGPEHLLLRRYLDLSEMPVPSQESGEAIAEIERRLGTADERSDDRVRALTLSKDRFTRRLEVTEFFVAKVDELRQQIIDTLKPLQSPVPEERPQPVEPQREEIGQPHLGTGTQTPIAPSEAAVEDKTITQSRMSWQEAAERLKRLRSQGDPWTSYATLAKRFGCSSQTLYKAIQNTPELQTWANRRTATSKAQSLNDVVIDRTAQDREPDPADDAAIREYLEREDLTPEERAFFNGLSRDDQLFFLSDPNKHQQIRGRKP